MAQIVALSYIKENFIKKNSANPNRPGKLVMINDEAHKSFPYQKSREVIGDVYRTARKRFVSPWTITQAMKDYTGYKETEAIMTQATAKILFKQDRMHRDFLLENTVLTPAQVDEVLDLGGDIEGEDKENASRKGEMCLICNDKVSFVKVDYLKSSEAYVVETDMKKLKEVLKGA